MNSVVRMALLTLMLAGCGESPEPNAPPPPASAPTVQAPTPEPMGSLFLPPPGTAKRASENQEIDWLDLMPDAEREALLRGEWPEADIDHESEGPMTQFGSRATVASMEGRRVRIPGYIVPLDFDAQQRVKSMFLVPYYGACIHVPPPPPNQLIYVELDPAIEVPSLWDAWWLTTTLRIEAADTELGSSSYRGYEATLEPWE